MSEFKELEGKIVERVEQIDNDCLMFYCRSGEVYKMYHQQDCCESVSIDEVHGDLSDIYGDVIASAEESVSSGSGSSSETFTFYHIRTHRRSITIRWYGESNGYYSESVYFELVDNTKSKTNWVRCSDWNWDDTEYGTELDLLLANQEVVYHKYSNGDDNEIGNVNGIDVLAVRLHKEE